MTTQILWNESSAICTCTCTALCRIWIANTIATHILVMTLNSFKSVIEEGNKSNQGRLPPEKMLLSAHDTTPQTRLIISVVSSKNKSFHDNICSPESWLNDVLLFVNQPSPMMDHDFFVRFRSAWCGDTLLISSSLMAQTIIRTM